MNVVSPRPAREQVDAALVAAEAGLWSGKSVEEVLATLAAEVRALRAELAATTPPPTKGFREALCDECLQEVPLRSDDLLMAHRHPDRSPCPASQTSRYGRISHVAGAS